MPDGNGGYSAERLQAEVAQLADSVGPSLRFVRGGVYAFVAPPVSGLRGGMHGRRVEGLAQGGLQTAGRQAQASGAVAPQASAAAAPLAGATAQGSQQRSRTPATSLAASWLPSLPQTCEDDYECNDGKANFPLQCCELPLLGKFCCEPDDFRPAPSSLAPVLLPVPVEDDSWQQR
eukprot:CAMPEP_0171246468 /NCGR_PEP_ID=MMETSP0790-20130122/47969_1 /TAXON_ID=2925 /ORGANISM="Alexandrium catenella, Strain OF101" /LENGTH=175 /DNA_ID=CAMNT_0011713795 /DNA_START=116 /DNA_END=644 /DNA_ORIENTATION=-